MNHVNKDRDSHKYNRGTLQEVLTCQDSIHNDMEQGTAKYFGSALNGKKKKC